MPIRTIKDIIDAYDEGRCHSQRFLKNASTTGDGQWIDWAYASGQPPYDARVGSPNVFTPQIAVKNDAIWFPAINSDQHRHLIGIDLRTLAGGTNQIILNTIVYDLLGVYPMIDGDSTDLQDMDNTATLPRYATGIGVEAVMVNHIAPLVSAGNGTMVYTSANLGEKTVTFRVDATGQNKVVSGIGTTGGVGTALTMRRASGCKGVLNIKSITFGTAVGGLYAIYLIKPLTTIVNNDGMAVAEKIFTEKSLLHQNGFLMPRIYDGAHLGFFLMPNGGARTISMFGQFNFIWG